VIATPVAGVSSFPAFDGISGVRTHQETPNGSSGRGQSWRESRQCVFIDSNHWSRGFRFSSGGIVRGEDRYIRVEESGGNGATARARAFLRDTCIYSKRAGQSRPARKVLREMDGPIFYSAAPRATQRATSGYPHIICIYTHLFARARARGALRFPLAFSRDCWILRARSDNRMIGAGCASASKRFVRDATRRPRCTLGNPDWGINGGGDVLEKAYGETRARVHVSRGFKVREIAPSFSVIADEQRRGRISKVV